MIFTLPLPCLRPVLYTLSYLLLGRQVHKLETSAPSTTTRFLHSSPEPDKQAPPAVTMHFLAALVAATAAFADLAVAGPLPQADAPSKVEARAPLVTCRPRLEGKTTVKTYTVDVARAQAQARVGGLTTGKSGDPHRYMNGDNLRFGKNNCDKSGAILWEYPIYWEGVKGDWQKDTKTDKQPNGATPIRTVYANVNGGIFFCGVMTHSTVTSNNQGKSFFQLCT
ncbi:hypothetical protein RB595_003934 [Gaeumannomyces hyphopodioides]